MAKLMEDSKPITVSVLVSTYNRAHFLPAALDSILGQTRPPDEVIVVDDGSTDKTAEAIASYGSRIQYHRLAQNQGKAAALNFILPLAQGSHIWIFDDDDVALPDALQSHVDFLVSHPDIDISYSGNYIYFGDGNIWQRDKWQLRIIPLYPKNEYFIRHASCMHTPLQGMLIPRRCFEAVGPFDQSLLRVQDNEMLLRLAHRFTADNLQRPTYVLRNHSGPRGPKSQEHAINKREAIWHEYRRQIYLKAREAYPLSSYLPHTPGKELTCLSAYERSCALLQRSCIMLQYGLANEALSDMQAALYIEGLSKLQKNHMGTLLSRTLNVDPHLLPHPYRLIFEIRQFLKVRHKTDFRPAIMHGIYWAFNRALRQYSWHDALRSVIMLGMLALPFPAGSPRGDGSIS